ncbi:helix-turn-helix domain-containing protein [Thiomicrospira microaerophila]|uniref:helix-turn-helix domain-containing protein n=1 Tax=Thiomicrospira microaerophila TaxID=406020 RepID=UPI0005CB25F9|nr:helix-turn-helix transcriptional regulator [Thiomicrospira microaerophila]
MNIIGPAVKLIRIEKGFTQEQLAAKFNLKGYDISRGTLAKIEVKKRRVTDWELKIICEVLSVPADILLERS